MRRALLLVPLLLFVACGSAEPAGLGSSPAPIENSSTPTPSVSATPTQEELDAEAERVFWRAVDLERSWDVTGEYTGFPEETDQVAMGEYLAAMRAGYDFVSEKGWVGRPEETAKYQIEPLPGVSLEESVVALHVCKDASNAHLYDKSGNLASKGNISESRYFFKFDSDGLLKIFIQQFRDVESCEK